MGGFYNPSALAYKGMNDICTVICVHPHIKHDEVYAETSKIKAEINITISEMGRPEMIVS